jgi:sirohydrochlorin cobaltochelatase
MTTSGSDHDALESLEGRIRTMLPEEYRDCYEDVKPVSMGTAGLKLDGDGNVAWDRMWSTFCDLAMAGGPPHKGTLLEPGSRSEIAAQPDRYAEVVQEICRGVELVTDHPVEPSPSPGWVRLSCCTEPMAQWLLRAIIMENVAARADGLALDLPAGPHFRLEKEIKNVVTVSAKTCHYWLGHTPDEQQRAIGELFVAMAAESPLVEPAPLGDGSLIEQEAVAARMAETLHARCELPPSTLRYVGWMGVECPDIRSAIWMMRALVVSNVLARRQERVLFVPVNPAQDAGGDRVVEAVLLVHRLAAVKGVL